MQTAGALLPQTAQWVLSPVNQCWDKQYIVDTDAVTTIGRSRSCTICCERDVGVSRVHCTLEKSDDGSALILVDNSKNGSRVNEKLLKKGEKSYLSSGSLVTLTWPTCLNGTSTAFYVQLQSSSCVPSQVNTPVIDLRNCRSKRRARDAPPARESDGEVPPQHFAKYLRSVSVASVHGRTAIPNPPESPRANGLLSAKTEEVTLISLDLRNVDAPTDQHAVVASLATCTQIAEGSEPSAEPALFDSSEDSHVLQSSVLELGANVSPDDNLPSVLENVNVDCTEQLASVPATPEENSSENLEQLASVPATPEQNSSENSPLVVGDAEQAMRDSESDSCEQAVREQVRSVLRQALSRHAQASIELLSCVDGIAAQIEDALFQIYGVVVKSKYRQHARMLKKNLADVRNKELRLRLLSGELGAAALVTMDSAAIAPKQLQLQREELVKQSMRSSTLPPQELFFSPSKRDELIPSPSTWR
eukprot:TRINITY_DN2428_c0_g1_i1.p1 TRINITY_DN2428_c0_g1~~TRINITY_DN2428_c0_g1_i1.p1  ORF type:complete len:476 (-),score=69.38 TRINITY_DN2428_c0_g1_i1:415-1842(-)